MADNKELKRIYRITAPDLDTVISKVQQLNKEIKLQQSIKSEANKIKLTANDDPIVLDRATKMLAQAEIAIKKLSVEKRIATKEADAMFKADERLKNILVAEAAAANAASGSISQAAAQYKALVAIARETPSGGVINWHGEEIGIDQAKIKLQGYRKTVDDFNRSLSPDGTLVGEYKTGILNAFKDLGLTGLIKDQKILIEHEIQDLITKNKQLVKSYQEAGQKGPEAFRAIEPTLERNIKRQKELEQQLKETNAALTHQGGVGTQVTSALNTGFRNLITTGLGVAGITVGLQGIFDFLGKANDEFKEAELNALRLQNALRNTGKEHYFNELIEQANTLATQIGYLDNDDIVRAQEKLVTYGKLTKAQILELIPTIINLAANLGTDLPTATGYVIKALEGQGRSLKEFGIRLKEGKTLTENFNLIQGDFAKRMQNSADVLKNSLAGGALTAEQRIRALGEEIGSKTAPIWLRFKENLFGAAKAAIDMSERLQLATSYTRALFRVLGSVAIQKYDFNNSLLGQFNQAVKETTNTQSSLLKDLNTKSKKEQDVFIDQQQVFVDGARVTYETLKASGTATQKEISRAQGVLFGYEKNLISLKKRQKELLEDTPAFTDEEDPEEAKKKAEAAAREREKVRKEEQDKKIRAIDTNELNAQVALEKRRSEGLVLEGEYESTLFDIKNEAQQKRINVLQQGTEQEKDDVAKIRLQMIKDAEEYNNKIFAILKKRIEGERDSRIAAANAQAGSVLEDPLATPEQKASAQAALTAELLDIQKEFNSSMSGLEKTFRKRSETNEAQRAEALLQIDRKLANDRHNEQKESFERAINDIEEEESNRITLLAQTLDKKVSDIIGSRKTPKQKEKELTNVRRDVDLSAVQIEIQAQEKIVKAFKDAREKNLVTDKEYNAQLKKLSDLRTENVEKEAKKLIDLEKYKIEAREALIEGGEQLVQTFLEGTFAAQEDRLAKESEVANKRLDLEKEQLLAQASTQQEREAIEKQFKVKKDEQDKIDFEKKKKQRVKEVLIEAAFGAAKAIAQNPPPSPVGLIQAAFIALQTAIQVANINKQQFAMGGKVLPRLTGQRINTTPNITALASGDNVLAYVRSGEVVLNRAQQRMLGGDETFRRLGVPGFYNLGGRIPGDSLRPPVNPSSFLGSGSSSASKEDVANLLSVMVDMNIETSKRIDRISVFQDPRTAMKAQDKIVKYDRITTL